MASKGDASCTKTKQPTILQFTVSRRQTIPASLEFSAELPTTQPDTTQASKRKTTSNAKPRNTKDVAEADELDNDTLQTNKVKQDCKVQVQSQSQPQPQQKKTRSKLLKPLNEPKEPKEAGEPETGKRTKTNSRPKADKPTAGKPRQGKLKLAEVTSVEVKPVEVKPVEDTQAKVKPVKRKSAKANAEKDACLETSTLEKPKPKLPRQSKSKLTKTSLSLPTTLNDTPTHELENLVQLDDPDKPVSRKPRANSKATSKSSKLSKSSKKLATSSLETCYQPSLALRSRVSERLASALQSAKLGHADAWRSRQLFCLSKQDDVNPKDSAKIAKTSNTELVYYGNEAVMKRLMAAVLSRSVNNIIVTGPTGTGKTWLLEQICCQWRALHGPQSVVSRDVLEACASTGVPMRMDRCLLIAIDDLDTLQAHDLAYFSGLVSTVLRHKKPSTLLATASKSSFSFSKSMNSTLLARIQDQDASRFALNQLRKHARAQQDPHQGSHQDPQMVAEIVSRSRGNLHRVKELVAFCEQAHATPEHTKHTNYTEHTEHTEHPEHPEHHEHPEHTEHKAHVKSAKHAQASKLSKQACSFAVADETDLTVWEEEKLLRQGLLQSKVSYACAAMLEENMCQLAQATNKSKFNTAKELANRLSLAAALFNTLVVRVDDLDLPQNFTNRSSRLTAKIRAQQAQFLQLYPSISALLDQTSKLQQTSAWQCKSFHEIYYMVSKEVTQSRNKDIETTPSTPSTSTTSSTSSLMKLATPNALTYCSCC